MFLQKIFFSNVTMCIIYMVIKVLVSGFHNVWVRKSEHIILILDNLGETHCGKKYCVWCEKAELNLKRY